MSTVRIPSLKDRIQAIIIDVLILFGCMFLTTYFIEKIGGVSADTKMYLFILFVFVYDPLLTTFGGTLGHRASGLRVKKENQIRKNISLPAALLRFIVKSLLGWLSLMSVSVNSKGKAMHDFAAGSIVIYKEGLKIANEDFLDALTEE